MSSREYVIERIAYCRKMLVNYAQYLKEYEDELVRLGNEPSLPCLAYDKGKYGSHSDSIKHLVMYDSGSSQHFFVCEKHIEFYKDKPYKIIELVKKINRK